MSRYSVAWKHFQRRLYSLLSSRRALAFCLIGVIITLNSTFRVGAPLGTRAAAAVHSTDTPTAEVLIGWSESSRALSLRPFRDNIAETDLQGRLCSPMPIDVVYTWVNGSDQRMQQRTARLLASGMCGYCSHRCAQSSPSSRHF